MTFTGTHLFARRAAMAGVKSRALNVGHVCQLFWSKHPLTSLSSLQSTRLDWSHAPPQSDRLAGDGLVDQSCRRLKSSLSVPNDRATMKPSKPSSSRSPAPSSTSHHRNRVENPLPDFKNSRAAYEGKTTQELLRAAICFRICKIPMLVNNAKELLSVSRRLLGNAIVDFALKLTLYGHFCAGEDLERIRPTLRRLEKAGVGSILDYVAEADPNDGTRKDVAPKPQVKSEIEHKIPAREYSYESEAKCDAHVGTFLRCIRDVASMGPDGYAAVKVTALGNPALLSRLSTAIVEAKRLFETFDENGDGVISREEFEIGYKRFFLDGETRIKEIFEEFDPKGTGYIDYITWALMLSPRDLPKIIKSCSSLGRLSEACPTDEEIELLDAMFDRGRLLGEEAAKAGTRLLIDAEQSWYQPAIDHLVLKLQQKFNATDVGDVPIIYNTYQCYRKDTPQRLRIDVDRSERFNYHFGAKLVRGAYMESERDRAEKASIPDPIHDSIEDTHACYNETVDYLLGHSRNSEKRVELMCATHNQTSIERAIESMNRHGIDRNDSTICFGQLYGMSDHLTFNLGSHGYRAFKYVPYGEVNEAISYLLRRARENSSVVGGAQVELEMINREIGRRLKLTN